MPSHLEVDAKPRILLEYPNAKYQKARQTDATSVGENGGRWGRWSLPMELNIFLWSGWVKFGWFDDWSFQTESHRYYRYTEMLCLINSFWVGKIIIAKAFLVFVLALSWLMVGTACFMHLESWTFVVTWQRWHLGLLGCWMLLVGPFPGVNVVLLGDIHDHWFGWSRPSN